MVGPADQRAGGPGRGGGPWEEASGRRAEDVPYRDAVAALNQPGDMAGFAPVMPECCHEPSPAMSGTRPPHV